MSKKLPAWLVLTLIALVAALALGATYNGTKDRIATQEAEKAVAVRQELLPAAQDFALCDVEEGVAEVWRGLNADGSDVGYVSTGTVTGFGGPIDITVGTDAQGVITGVRVGGANFQETAGLGAKSKEPAFYEQFTGKEYPVDLSKNGGEIDAITAATITSSAVVRGVNDTLKVMSTAAGFKINEPIVLVDELGNNHYATSKKGFGGDVYVELTVENGSISGIIIGDDRFNETAGYGARAKEESFWGQYIGKSGTNLVLGQDIDAISGATITSTAVNDAVNMILLYVNDPAAFAAQMASMPEEIDVSIPEGAVIATASAKGLTGKFDVTIGVDENGAVNGIEIGAADNDADAAFLGQVSSNNAFLSQFIGTTGNVSAEGLDLVTGATISSRGVVDAVNKAYNQAMGIEEPAATQAPVQEADGNTVKADGLTGKFDVTVELNDDGTVAAVTLGKSDSSMDESFLAKLDDAFLAQFVGKTLPVTGIDTVSGATVSSNAVIAAVNSFSDESPAEEVPVEEPAEELPPEGTEYKTTAQGFIDLMAIYTTINDDGVVTGVRVAESSSATDASYVSKVAVNKAFLSQFIGKTGEINASDIDIVSGATYSSRAVIEGVNKALSSVQPVEELPAEGTEYESTAQGFMDLMTVYTTINDDGVVTGVRVAESASETDASYVSKVAADKAFLRQFVGKSEVINSSDIDVVSGATYSSRGVIEGVNRALAAAKSVEQLPPEGTEYKTTAQGFIDLMVIYTTINDEGEITAVRVAESSSDTDASYVAKVAADKAFLTQFVGKTGEINASDIDIVTGATYSSRAVIEGVNKALSSVAVAVPQ